MPKPRSYEEIRKDLQLGIKEGKYLLGELIEPKKYKKYSLVNGKVEEIDFTVSGRKIPLNEIRRKLYLNHLKSGILRKKEEYIKTFVTMGRSCFYS